MSVGKRKISGKSLAFGTALLTVMALAIPFMGSASAVSPTEPKTLTLSPAQDSASVGVCNARSLTVTDTNGNPVVGQTVTVDISQTSPAGLSLAIGFCAPTPSATTGAPQTPTSANKFTGTNTRCSAATTDFNGTTAFGATTSNQPVAGSPGQCAAGTTAAPPATAANSCSTTNTAPNSANQGSVQTTLNCSGDFFTDSNGEVFFGVASTRAGTMTIQARILASQSRFGANASNLTIYSNQSTKTWVAGGNAASAHVACVWDDTVSGNSSGSTTNYVPDNETQEFVDCKVTDAQGNPVNGALLNYVVNSGPDTTPNPNQNGGPTPCQNSQNGTQFTSGAGTAQCVFFHTQRPANTPPGNGSGGVGTDNVTFYIEQGCPPPPNSGTTVCGPGPQTAYEPFVTLTKTFFGAPRNIACTPATGSNPAGSTHIITCLVTDELQQPVPGTAVIGTETGPGRFSNANSANCSATTGQTCVFTNASGQAEFTATTNTDETGQESFTFSITGSNPFNLGNQCSNAAGNPRGTTTAGNCTSQTTKDWTTSSPSPTVHTRTITITVTRTGSSCRTAKHPRRCHRRHPNRHYHAKVTGTLNDTTQPGFADCISGKTINVTQPGGASHAVLTNPDGSFSTRFGHYRHGSATATIAAETVGNVTCSEATASA